MNKVILHGRLAWDPEARLFGEHKKVTFSIAVQRIGKNAPADFFNCQCWGKTADLIELYFSKGREILIEGQLRTDMYTNKEGKKATATYVYVEHVDFCGSKDDAASKQQDAPKQETKPTPAQKADDSEFLDVQMNLDDLDEMPFI